MTPDITNESDTEQTVCSSIPSMRHLVSRQFSSISVVVETALLARPFFVFLQKSFPVTNGNCPPTAHNDCGRKQVYLLKMLRR